MDELYQRVAALELEQRGMKASFVELQQQRTDDNRILHDLHKDVKAVKEIVTAWNNLKGFMAVMGFVRTLVKICLWIAAIILAIYIFVKTGKLVLPDIGGNGE